MNWLTKVFVLMGGVFCMAYGEQLYVDRYIKEDTPLGVKYKTEENLHQRELKDMNNGTEFASTPESQPESEPRSFTRRRIISKTNINGRCASCRNSTFSSRKRTKSQAQSKVFPRENKYPNAARFGVTQPSADTTSGRRFTQNRRSKQSTSTQPPLTQNNFKNLPVTTPFRFGTDISAKNAFGQNRSTKNHFDTNNLSRNNFKRRNSEPVFQSASTNFETTVLLPQEASFALNFSPTVEAPPQSFVDGVIVSNVRNSNEFVTKASVGNFFGSQPSLQNSFGIQDSVRNRLWSQSFPETDFRKFSSPGSTSGSVTASVINVGSETPKAANKFLSSTTARGVLGDTPIQQINSGWKQLPFDVKFGSGGSSLIPNTKIDLNSNSKQSNFPGSNNFGTGITVDNRFIVQNPDKIKYPNIHQNTAKFSSLTAERENSLGTVLSDGRWLSDSTTVSSISAETNLNTGNSPGISSGISGSPHINVIPNAFSERTNVPNSNLPNLSVNFGVKQKNGSRKFIKFPSPEDFINRINPKSLNTFYSAAATTTPLPHIPSFNVPHHPSSSEGGSGSSNVSFRFTPQTNAAVRTLVGSLLNVLSSLLPTAGGRYSQPAEENGTPRFANHPPPQQSVWNIPSTTTSSVQEPEFSSPSDVHASRNKNSLSADETKIDFNINTFIQIGSK